LANVQFDIKRHDGVAGIHCIATGLNYFPISKNDIENWKHATGIDYYELCQQTWDNWKDFREIWQKEADESPTMYQWLKENRYHDKS